MSTMMQNENRWFLILYSNNSFFAYNYAGDVFSCITNNYPQVEDMVDVYGISICGYHTTNCAGK